MKRYEGIRARAWMQTFAITCLTLSAMNAFGMEVTPEPAIGASNFKAAQEQVKKIQLF